MAAAKLGLVFCRSKSMCDPPFVHISQWKKNVAAATIYFDVLIMMPLEGKISNATVHRVIRCYWTMGCVRYEKKGDRKSVV